LCGAVARAPVTMAVVLVVLLDGAGTHRATLKNEAAGD